ncbi:site-specific recombinase XerD [Natronococcus occultus SP4]|uniref:Site-specific recombinase XerD n=1 Tax=Natronococcus occultus SP4 TaxID=694430 RepID=L0JV68_9EURY|nr:site-specific recombinase XerD [Natronococcus occultus SP4]
MLKETTPAEAKDRYLREKRTHVSQKTLHNYTAALNAFADWLVNNGYLDMRDVDSNVIEQYKDYRLQKVKPITARNDLWTIKGFIQACERYQAVSLGTYDLVQPPQVRPEDEICDDVLTREEAQAILEHLEKFEYASLRHVIVLILWKTGMRIGGLRALDVGDFDGDRPALEVRHRPEQGTPLKRRLNSERDVLLTDSASDVILDYLDTSRPSVTDDYGRKPLIATDHGRAARTTITRHVYGSTRPCFYSNSCPFDDKPDPENCEATSWNMASKCPGSVSPHALRRGYVTAARNAGQPKEITSERVNMSGKILEKHYDKGTHDEKAERRKEFLKDI